MRTTWPRGSEWRKWDLHLHAPDTKLNDQFTVQQGDKWDDYCKVLHESDVEVFGITDYFSSDGYYCTLDRFRERYPDSSKVFLCNIELRISEVVNQAQEEVNIHLLFNTFRSDFDQKLRFFLHSLKTNKTGDGDRHQPASELNTKTEFESATTTRRFIREALDDAYGPNADLLDHLLILTAANNDGIRAERGKKRKLLITDEIDKFSDGFFGNSNNSEYFLNTQRGEDKTEHFDPKPVLSGSDAHSFGDLATRLGQVVSDSQGKVLEPTWIKADPTYEGLKQIIFEPGNRVYIGEEPKILSRVRNNKTRYIDKISITSIDDYKGHFGSWFEDEEIELGSELVAIIGNKGSGKSAVTDIIGLLGNSHNQVIDSKRTVEELFSFLNKEKFLRKGCAANFTAQLSWHQGQSDRKRLSEKIAQNLPERVEYLPQKYLEKICANIADDEFRSTLNDVVFRYVQPPNRFGRSSLEDLVSYLTHQADQEIAKHKDELHQTNERIVSIERKLVADYREEIEAKIREKREQLDAHQATRPPAKAKPEKDSSTEVSTELERLSQEITKCDKLVAQLKTEQSNLTHLVEELRQAKQTIERAAQNLRQVGVQYHSVLESAGLSFDNIVKLELDYGTLNEVVTEKVERLNEIDDLLATELGIQESIAGRADDQEAMSFARSKSIVCKKARLETRRTQLVESQTKPAREYQEYMIKIAEWAGRDKEIRGDGEDPAEDSLRGLQIELEKISSRYLDERLKACNDRLLISNQLFRMKKGLTQVYDQIKQSIDSEIMKYRSDLGNYSITIEAGLRFDQSFYDNFLQYINQGRKGSFHGIDEGRSMLRSFCEDVDNWEDEEEVLRVLGEIVNALHIDQRSGLDDSDDTKRDVFSQMKNQTEPVIELYDYIFGFDYLQPKYDLKVDQKDLSELSPGERGGLLLVFYLILDRRDVPLIIDQPEDNLDNKSVYEILVKFIKYAKMRRQIILVTHNPNLAVVADAEQIIHVSIDKMDGSNDFDFFSGGLEDPQINKSVVDILEGTMPAFDNRRLKYRRQK